MSLQKKSDVIIFGGIPLDHRGRALGPFRIRTVVEKMGLTASIIDHFWGRKSFDILRHIDYCCGENTIIFGISYTWIRDLMEETLYAKDPILFVGTDYTSMEELLNIIISWLKQKYPKIQIVIGSANSATIDKNLISKVDWVVDGFAELSLPALITHLLNGSDLKYSNRQGINYIDSNIDYKVTDLTYLNVDYKLSDNFAPHQPLTLETCRGCLWNCAYCTYAFRGKKDYEYLRSTDHIANELRRNYELFGTTRYIIADDTFNDSEEKITRLLKAVNLAKLPDFNYVCYLRPEMLVTRPNMIPLLIELGLSGAHLGLESFNTDSRKLMGRGGNIENIKEKLVELKQRSKNYVGLYGSFIIGLPYDSIDDIRLWNQELCNQQSQFLDNWLWYTLQINQNNIGEKIIFNSKTVSSQSNQSLIECNPEKYGYEIDYTKNNFNAWWKNKFMTVDQANNLSKELFNINKNYIGFGGWLVAFAWYFNLSDQYIRKEKLSSVNFKIAGRESVNSRFNNWENIISNNV